MKPWMKIEKPFLIMVVFALIEIALFVGAVIYILSYAGGGIGNLF